MKLRSIVLISLLVPLFSFRVAGSEKEGDRHWASRAEGHREATALAEPVDAAIAAYSQALKVEPNDLEARWKLLRALRFKASYVVRDEKSVKALFDEGRKLGQGGIFLVEEMLRERGILRPDEASASEVARVAREIPGAGELYLWDAILWGEWAQVHGKLAAVRQGAADRIRREARIALEIDPAMEGAGPGRVLGRLHNQTPRVPLITGWASDEEAVRFLRRSLELNPGDKLTKVFLAEAWVAADRNAKPQAKKLLAEVLEMPDDPEYAVEHASARKDARRLLDSW